MSSYPLKSQGPILEQSKSKYSLFLIPIALRVLFLKPYVLNKLKNCVLI